MYLKYKLNNGITVVMEEMPYMQSASIGILINNGSVNEKKEINGVSHFIEHMLFKGTDKRSAKEISETIDNIGGQLNAFTDKEYTCFYSKVLSCHISIAIDVLSDMMINSKFLEEDMEREKKVISEEINMYLDSPEDVVYDLLYETIYKDTPLSLSVLGTEDSLNSLSREGIVDYYHKYYNPENMVISVAGNIKSKEIIKILEEKFGGMTNEKKGQAHLIQEPLNFNDIKGMVKKTEQLNFCIGMEGVSRESDDTYPLLILNTALGGSSSSILFQKIREEEGLAYTVYSTPFFHRNTGIFSIYAGLNSNNILEFAKIIKKEIKNIKDNSISSDDLLKLKEQLKGSYILGLESTLSRMMELGKSQLLFEKVITSEDVIKKIDKVTLEDIKRVSENIFDFRKYDIAYVGEISKKEKIESELKNILFI